MGCESETARVQKVDMLLTEVAINKNQRDIEFLRQHFGLITEHVHLAV